MRLLKKTFCLVIISVILFYTGIKDSASADNYEKPKETNEDYNILDIVKAPIKTIFRPINKGGLFDLIPGSTVGDGPDTVNLGEIVITPGRATEYSFNINKSISVIDSGEIEDNAAINIQEMIAQEPGVSLSGYLGNAKDNNISFRGFGETGNVNYVALIDGRRVNQIDLSGPDLSQIDINSIDRVEIIRGPGSVLYGDNATGGVMNIISKKGKSGDKLRYTQEFGSYNYLKEYFSAEGGHDFMDYFFSYSYQDTRGYRINNRYEANDLLSSITIRPEEYFHIMFSSSYHRDWYGTPGALFLRNIETDGRRHSRFPDDKTKTEDYYVTIEPRLFGEGVDQEYVFSCPVTYRTRRKNYVTVGFNTYKIDDHIINWNMRPKVDLNFDFLDGKVENKAVMGADYYYALDQITSGDIAVTPSRAEIEKQTLGLYAQDNMLIDGRFLLSTGFRGEMADYKFDQDSPAFFSEKRTLKEWAVDAGLGYKYNESSVVYLNYARSYRYPVTDEYFQSAFEYINFVGAPQVVAASLNTALKQQVGNNYEIGIKDNSFDFINIEAAYYLIDNKNEIFFDPQLFVNRNYHHIMRHGMELELKGNIVNKMDVFFNYTFQKAFFVEGTFAGNTVPLVPSNSITAGGTVEPVKNLKINCVMNYLGSRYLASDQMNNRGKLKEYITVDIGAGYEINNIRIFGSIKNIFDKEYFQSGGFSTWSGDSFYPASGRQFEVGMTITF